MKRLLMFGVLLCCLLMGGCAAIFDGSYVSVKPHTPQSSATESQKISAANYEQLYDSLTELIQDGVEEGIISVADYDQDLVKIDIGRVIASALSKNPIAAYAVEHVDYELGKRNGQAALAVHIQYSHNASELRKIKEVSTYEDAQRAIANALKQCEVDIVLLDENYEETDFVQVVESYAMDYPQYVMEQPQVNVGIYPDSGSTRVVALHFTYQTGRDSLKTMSEWVQNMFTSAALYVAGDSGPEEKYAQLYAFLMERFEYKLETSITPAYSLLHYGVGDSRAFAMVYGAMCRQVGLECLAVSGTREGESHYWNMICIDDVYYHVDLLSGSFQKHCDEQMDGYVWDYSAYPSCG